MSEIINLRRVRKKIAREKAEQNAVARRLEFGRSKVQRDAETAAKRRDEASLDGHRRIREEET